MDPLGYSFMNSVPQTALSFRVEGLGNARGGGGSGR